MGTKKDVAVGNLRKKYNLKQLRLIYNEVCKLAVMSLFFQSCVLEAGSLKLTRVHCLCHLSCNDKSCVEIYIGLCCDPEMELIHNCSFDRLFDLLAFLPLLSRMIRLED